MAQAGPVTDVVQRLFTELKSKNEEVRVRASFELYDNVLTVSRGEFLRVRLSDKLTY
jgi:FKBP12-rapamycin complex-associated protein